MASVAPQPVGGALPAAVVLCGYIADFYASESELVVQVDGPWHAQRRGDARRDRVLQGAGYQILRIAAPEVVAYR